MSAENKLKSEQIIFYLLDLCILSLTALFAGLLYGAVRLQSIECMIGLIIFICSATIAKVIVDKFFNNDYPCWSN